MKIIFRNGSKISSNYKYFQERHLKRCSTKYNIRTIKWILTVLCTWLPTEDDGR